MSFQLLEMLGGSWVQTPDSSALSIEDDLDLRIRVTMDDWFPTSRQTFIAKSTGGEEWSFHTDSGGSGWIGFVWVDSTPTTHIDGGGVPVPFENGDTAWLRVVRSGTDLDYYYSLDDTDDHTAVSWTVLASNSTSAGSIDSTISSAVTIGASRTNGDDPIRGYIHAAAILDDTTVVADPQFSDSTEWTQGENGGDSDTGTDDAGVVWTLGGTAEIIGPNIQGAYVTLDAGFGTDPFYNSIIWTSLRSDLRGVEFQRGRQYELDRIEAGTMNVLLDNRHGNYNSHNTAGAYYPNIKPTVPIRLRAVYDGVVYPLWSGFVERWPVSFPGGKDSVVQVQCVDMFKLLALAKATTENRVAEVEALNPVAYWRFGDSSDGTGTGHTLTANGGLSFGGGAGAWEGDDATTFDGSDDYATVASEADVELVQLDRSWEAWVYPSSSGAGSLRIVSVRDANVVTALGFNHSTGSFFGALVGSNGGFATDTWHHVVVTTDTDGSTRTETLYVNGTNQGSVTLSDPSETPTVILGAGLNGATAWWNGRISEIAVYDTVLTATQVATLFDNKSEVYADQLTSARIALLLDNFTFPISPPQNLETGQTTMDGPNTPTGGTLLAAIQTVAETENGVFFIAGDGDATFHDRDYRSMEQSVSTATFGPNDLTIYDIDLGLDDERIFNEIKVKPDDTTAPFISRDEDSITSHGRRTFERTIYPANPDEALDAANWLRASHAEAAPRIGTMWLRLGPHDTALWPVVLGAEISNRYTIEKTTTGDDYSDDHYLESISMRILAMKTWEASMQLSPASQLVAFILDDDVLGLLDGVGVLGY